MELIFSLITSSIDFAVNIVASSASFGTNLQRTVQNIIGPIFLVVLGIVAFTFLFQRQMMQFVIFLVIAIVVAAVIYVPTFIANIGRGVGGEVKW